MILILEGPNKCGKTTLAKYLVQKYDFRYFKDYTVNDCLEFGLDDPNETITLEICAQARLLSSLSYNTNIVVDRFHLSEYVYGLSARGYYSEAIEEAEKIFVGHNVKLLVLTDEIEKIYERLGRDAANIFSLYNRGFEKSRLNKLLISDIFAVGQRSIISAFIGFDVTGLKNSLEEKVIV